MVLLATGDFAVNVRLMMKAADMRQFVMIMVRQYEVNWKATEKKESTEDERLGALFLNRIKEVKSKSCRQ